MLKALSSKVSSVARAARELRQQHVQWHKINIDKGQRLHDGTAACGGIIQDDTVSRYVVLSIKFDSLEVVRSVQSDSSGLDTYGIVLHVKELCARNYSYDSIGRDG
ncbi:hypothetical protein V6N13_012791 [Hibiscus sabdariffa]